MSFIHGKEETGQHNDNHCHSCKGRPRAAFEQKKSGNPTRRAAPRQTICRFVRLNATLVLILDRSLGTVTYAKRIPPFTKKYCCVLLHFPIRPNRACVVAQIVQYAEISHKRDNLFPRFVWLLAVLFYGANNKLMYCCGFPFRVSFRCKQTNFRISPCPKAQAIKPRPGFRLSFNQTKATLL